MKQLIKVIIVAVVLCGAANNSINAQCKGFAKSLCKSELGSYLHDGNYHAAVLVEGEEAELYKTFYSGQKYRIAICATETLPGVEFKVVDAYKNVLFDNTKHNNVGTWDFTLESSQQLKIIVKVPLSNTKSEYPNSGCVSIMFGFQEK